MANQDPKKPGGNSDLIAEARAAAQKRLNQGVTPKVPAKGPSSDKSALFKSAMEGTEKELGGKEILWAFLAGAGGDPGAGARLAKSRSEKEEELTRIRRDVKEIWDTNPDLLSDGILESVRDGTFDTYAEFATAFDRSNVLRRDDERHRARSLTADYYEGMINRLLSSPENLEPGDREVLQRLSDTFLSYEGTPPAEFLDVVGSSVEKLLNAEAQDKVMLEALDSLSSEELARWAEVAGLDPNLSDEEKRATLAKEVTKGPLQSRINSLTAVLGQDEVKGMQLWATIESELDNHRFRRQLAEKADISTSELRNAPSNPAIMSKVLAAYTNLQSDIKSDLQDVVTIFKQAHGLIGDSSFRADTIHKGVSNDKTTQDILNLIYEQLDSREAQGFLSDEGREAFAKERGSLELMISAAGIQSRGKASLDKANIALAGGNVEEAERLFQAIPEDQKAALGQDFLTAKENLDNAKSVIPSLVRQLRKIDPDMTSSLAEEFRKLNVDTNVTSSDSPGYYPVGTITSAKIDILKEKLSQLVSAKKVRQGAFPLLKEVGDSFQGLPGFEGFIESLQKPLDSYVNADPDDLARDTSQAVSNAVSRLSLTRRGWLGSLPSDLSDTKAYFDTRFKLEGVVSKLTALHNSGQLPTSHIPLLQELQSMLRSGDALEDNYVTSGSLDSDGAERQLDYGKAMSLWKLWDSEGGLNPRTLESGALALDPLTPENRRDAANTALGLVVGNHRADVVAGLQRAAHLIQLGKSPEELKLEVGPNQKWARALYDRMPQLGQRVIQAHGLATTLALGGELSGEKGDAGLFSPDFDSEDPEVISSFIAQMVGIDLSSGNPEQQTRAHQVVGPVLGRFQTALTAREKHEKDKTSRTSRPYDRTEIDSFTTELLHSLVDAGLLDDWLQDTQVDDEAKAEFSLVEGRVWLKATMVEMLDNYANTVVPSFGETNFQGLDPKYVTGDLSRFQLLATAGISDDDEIVGFLKEKEGELDLKSLSYIWSSLMLTAAGQGNLPETPPLSYLTQIPVMGPGVHPPPWLAQPGPPPSEQYTDPSRDPHATGPLISPTYMD